VSAWRRILLPVLGRHLRREFLRTFVLTLLAFVAIYVIADFFDRFDDFLKHEASFADIVRSFLFKVPMVVTQVAPIAVLAGGLVGLGLLARNNEFVALRACGVSIWQIMTPLVALASVIAVGVFVWNETVVPASARRWHQVWSQDIKKKKSASVFTGREVWFHGKAGFYNVNRVAMRRQALLGITIYQLGQDFRPVRMIQAASAIWDGNRWELIGPRTREFGPEGVREFEGQPDGFALPESLEDFRVVSVEPEEFSYRMLRRQIHGLQAKGVDASESWVDLHLKLALPAASIILMLVAVPLATRGTRVSSLPAAAALGFALGFSYFIVLAFARALGQTGTLPPLIAAWTSNAVFALIATYLLLGAD
jgi:lipopolysaccharide export system permease protein